MFEDFFTISRSIFTAGTRVFFVDKFGEETVTPHTSFPLDERRRKQQHGEGEQMGYTS